MHERSSPAGRPEAALPLPPRRTCRWLAVACRLLAVTLPALVAWSVLGHPLETLLHAAGLGAGGLSAAQRLLIRILALLPAGCAAYGLWQASRCLAGLARGDYFSEATAQALERLGIGMFGAGIAGLLVAPMAGLVATWQAGPGPRALALSLDANALLPLLFGAVVWQIATVLRRAIAIARENEQFV